jgi:UDP-glucose 4-epimerase
MVIGADGFIGRHVAAALESEFSVIPVGHRDRGPSKGIDITDAAAVDALFAREKPDVVIHLAAIAHKKRGAVAAGEYDRVNHWGFRNVLNAATTHGVRRVLFASSASVYGDLPRREPLAETAVLAPKSPYGLSKLDAEAACSEPAFASVEKVIFRFPPLYASEWLLNVRNRAYIPGLERRVLLTIIGRQPYYSFCAIQNAVRAVRMGIDPDFSPGLYNVADDKPFSQREVRSIVGDHDGARLVLPVPASLMLFAARVGAKLLPTRLSDMLVSNMNKLFVGLVLDTTKIRAAGLHAPQAMRELLEAQ